MTSRALRCPAASPLRGTTALALALALGACAKPTKITLEISSDVPCAGLRGVAISVGAPNAVEGREPVATTTQCSDEADGARIGTLVVVPSGKADDLIALRVSAGVERPVGECASAGDAGCIVARRILPFVRNEELVVRVRLSSACVGVGCDGAATCVEGACASARVDPTRCTGGGCGDEALGPAAPRAETDGGVVGPDAGGGCGEGKKLCDGQCVEQDNARYGCTPSGCAACPGVGIASSVCNGAACVTSGCGTTHKSCFGNCVPRDPLHGCGEASCASCESANGKASCAASGACVLTCDAGSKLCGGRCVKLSDPNYGCGTTTCDKTACPDPGAGTLVCAGTSCVVGTCGPGTKQCGSACVPTDPTNGCEDPARCAPCGAGEVCTGAPSKCTCVPEPKETTCATKACGQVANNCNELVDCPDTCQAPNVCGGGGAGKNGCGCDADNVTACLGKACGPAVNNCGQPILSCGTCAAPKTCGGGGAGPNGCGCTPIPKAEACPEPCGKAPNGCGGYYTCGTLSCR